VVVTAVLAARARADGGGEIGLGGREGGRRRVRGRHGGGHGVAGGAGRRGCRDDARRRLVRCRAGGSGGGVGGAGVGNGCRLLGGGLLGNLPPGDEFVLGLPLGGRLARGVERGEVGDISDAGEPGLLGDPRRARRLRSSASRG
jgi:hypothetical protein